MRNKKHGYSTKQLVKAGLVHPREVLRFFNNNVKPAYRRWLLTTGKRRWKQAHDPKQVYVTPDVKEVEVKVKHG